ncbi:MAG: hydantoinase/oxoprolinase family protein [Deltaproteobacteria bacterium]|nr:hydantoinase/oxoprolinase family protein [Candidatus Zymogenaceae bacterium]
MPNDTSPLLFLGIDTGGTFTDAALWDASAGRVVSRAKAPTTHSNLSVGVINAIQALDVRRFAEIGMVGLSTTLATNAIVERTGRPVGLIIVGYDGDVSVPIPRVRTVRITGGHDVAGRETAPLDEHAVRRFAEAVRGDVESFACAAYFSVRNPDHELRVEKLLAQKSRLPVVSGHRLSSDLNFPVRAVTAALNAGLIPLIAELLDAVGHALCAMNITAPLMVVKGDGSLMSEKTARERPIETILSGPAASVVGSAALLGKHDIDRSVVVDVGGTTTDIAILDGGLPRLSDRGARVGEWRTSIHAVDARTVGLGGDSIIDYSLYSPDIVIGPGRILPLGRLAEEHPGIKDILSRREDTPGSSSRRRPTDFVAAGPGSTPRMFDNLPNDEQELYDKIARFPVRAEDLGRGTEHFRAERVLDRLIHRGVLIRAGLTPTDIFNARGSCRVGDVEASQLALEAAAAYLSLPPGELSGRVQALLSERVILEAITAVLGHDGEGNFQRFGVLADTVTGWLHGSDNGSGLGISFVLDRVLVGAGAPAQLFLQPAAERLVCRLAVPEDAPVANAVGAVSGVVMETRTAVVRSDTTKGYVLFGMEKPTKFKTLDEAKRTAWEMLSSDAVRVVMENGGVDVEIDGGWRETAVGEGKSRFVVESTLVLRAVGRPGTAAV